MYDDAGNRTSHTNTDGTTVGYTVDATGQLVSDTTGTTYTYDDAGNLTATSDGDSYSYDDYGRTTAVTSNGVTATFGYDAADVRVSVNGEAQLWDRNGGLPTLISTDTGDNYVHTAGISRDGDDWLLADAVGSVRATVDQTGATVGSQDFTVFGEQLSGTGSFGFAGEQQDPTGQLHLRARQYNPGLGRFTSVDPVQPGGPATTGCNLYAYSGNNPTTWTDPSGQAVLVESSTTRSVSQPTAAALSRAKTAADFAAGVARAKEVLALNALYAAPAYAAPPAAGGLGIGLIFWLGAVVVGGSLILGGDTPEPTPTSPLPASPAASEPVPDDGDDSKPEPELEPSTDGANDGEDPPCTAPPWLGGELPPDEEAALNETLEHIKNGTQPSEPKVVDKWGSRHGNREGNLPGGQGVDSPYREYRVRTGDASSAGTRRVVINQDTGAVYYSWTHYGQACDPPFTRLN